MHSVTGLLPLRRIQFVFHFHLVLAGILQPPDSAGLFAFVVPAIPVSYEHVAVRIEDDMAGAEMRISAGEERLSGDDVAASIGNEAEDGPVGPGKAMSAPVVAKQIALVFFRPGGSVIAQKL